ncbi:MAG: OmpA family protein [Alphaproteobacteria bacterium]|nr:OmpA family protein [Alphaproteobacteria bacterium]
MRFLRPGTLPTLVCLALVACVPKGRYELSEIQLEATRTAMAARDVDAREALEASRKREEALKTQLAELTAVVETQKGHLAELEKELDRTSIEVAEHVLRDQTECPPLPEAVECPPTDAPPPEPPEPEAPEVQQRRAHVEASVEDMADALSIRAHARLEAAKRAEQHTRVVEAFQGLVREGLAVVEEREGASVVRLLVAKLYNENRTTLSPLGVSAVERIAAALRELPDHELVVVGHTDDQANYSATLASNWELGFAYAVGVLRPLQDEGVAMTMSAASRGGTQPRVDPVDDEARRLNRRVELVLTPRDIQIPETDGPPSPEGGEPAPKPAPKPKPGPDGDSPGEVPADGEGQPG